VITTGGKGRLKPEREPAPLGVRKVGSGSVARGVKTDEGERGLSSCEGRMRGELGKGSGVPKGQIEIEKGHEGSALRSRDVESPRLCGAPVQLGSHVPLFAPVRSHGLQKRRKCAAKTSHRGSQAEKNHRQSNYLGAGSFPAAA